VALITATACASPLLPEGWQLRQPASPLIPGDNAALTQNSWQVVEVTQRGAPVEIDSIQPLFVRFTANGAIGLYSPDCFGDSYWITAEDERHYRLRSMVATGAQCGDPQDLQRVAMSKALLATREYELQGDRLFLTGPEVRIVLVISSAQ
jgi:hypothetical protein